MNRYDMSHTADIGPFDRAPTVHEMSAGEVALHTMSRLAVVWALGLALILLAARHM